MNRLLLLVLPLLMMSCGSQKVSDITPAFSDIERGFKQIPDSVKLAVYWYWLSNNISADGVVKDLKAMKEVGINRVFIGNIAEPNIAEGNVPMFSEEWWKILHTALKTSSELNIEVGMFNSPGWSQSGGPWIKQSESMRYLASSSVKISGKGYKEFELPEIKGAMTFKVLAYPAYPEYSKNWNISKKEGENLELELISPDATMRSLIFQTNQITKTTAKLYAKNGNDYHLVKSFDIDRSNPNTNVGYDPYAPIVISLPELSSREFRLVLSEDGNVIGKLTLTSKAYVERYPEKILSKMFQTPLPMWADYLWDEQPEVTSGIVINKEDIIDLTEMVGENQIVKWNVPEGEWNVVRYAMQTTGEKNAPASPEATGLEVDKMSKKHIRTHFNAYLGEILRRIPPEDRTSFKVAVMDSYETGGQNWTDDMESRFEQVYGYNPIPYLPVLRGEVVGSRQISDRFLWDLRRLIADRISYDYVGGLREVCHENGLTTWLENYGHWGFPGEFLQYGGQSDEVGGEFWSEGSLGDIENRAASSCAHIYGKNKVWAESFTAGGKAFARYPYLMKQRGDRFFTEGINSTLLHLYIHQPYDDKFPGINAWFGNEFNRKNNWFSHLDIFLDYLKRCSFMLQQGTYVADVAYFIGEDTPKMTGITEPKLPLGYSFDYVNAEVIKEASMQNGLFTLKSGMQYKVLVLPQLHTMRPELLAKIQELVKEGLVILGPQPTASPSLENYPQSDSIVKTIAQTMWLSDDNPKAYGKGVVYQPTHGLNEILLKHNVKPDFQCDNDSVLFIHKKLDEGDIYFISNQTDKQISTNAIFRVSNIQPELWNPLTGEIRYLTEYQLNEQSVAMPLTMEGFESYFIVFRDKPKELVEMQNFPKSKVEKNISGIWSVNFEQPAFGYDTIVNMKELKDWTHFDDKNLKYFSGKATYSINFNLEKLPDDIPYIDLGSVMVMAKVFINGQYAGGAWTPPYRIPVNGLLKLGKNKLEIVVVNNWVNRIIGDLQLPKEERKIWTNVIPWDKSSPLQPSGLFGPVNLITYPFNQSMKLDN